MKELFGIPMDTLTLALAIMLAALVGAIALLAIRNSVLSSSESVTSGAAVRVRP